ncbi:hypothetical protein NX059_009943 [Plenodomus lindquistii]|nr:hypothetical protein NX059_009943 [Plenodomus lindquistii]
MYLSTATIALAATLFTTVHSHAAILAAEGDKGTSQGFLVDPEIARNCTTISPCQQDATIIRDSEITQNIVNACGRTEIAGNIDIGEQTENELAAGRMTQVSSGSMLAVTIHQVNADGAGPFECDMDETSNAVTTFTPLTVSNNVPGSFGLSQEKEKDFTINVQMPKTFNCLGASTGNICTIRCRNTAIAGPFGGCFAVQQTDGTGRQDDTAASLAPPNPAATQAPTAGNGNGNGNQNAGQNGGNGRGQGNGRGSQNAGQNAGSAGNSALNAGQGASQTTDNTATGSRQGQNAGNPAQAGNAAQGSNGFGGGRGGRGGRNNGNRKQRRSGFFSEFWA